MIDSIVEIKNKCNFDFRTYAFANDPLAYLFDERVDYYKTQHAICRVLQPGSILEIGVRFGYSAISFLTAVPEARYLGIDNISSNCSSSGDAREWAKKITRDFNACFLIADAGHLSSFPDDYYDLVHVNGRQNGDETFHNLELSLEKSSWILVGGYFDSKEIMLSATYFMEKYKAFIEGAYIIFEYEGSLLIKTRNTPANRLFSKSKRNYIDLQHDYDRQYFLSDCGGYSSFKQNSGLCLSESRLRTLYHIAKPTAGMKVLDIGCGRGKLCFAFFEAGAQVTGVDYSDDAIAIATAAYKEWIGVNLQFIQGDFLAMSMNESCFDLIILADVVEHLEHNALLRLLEICRAILKDDGRVLIHTRPNKLYVQYMHREMRKKAASIGVYTVQNPRTYYEDLMHINEQTPSSLRKYLRTFFANVILWAAGDHDMRGTLAGIIGVNDYARLPSLFAVASPAPMSSHDIVESLEQNRLVPSQIDVAVSCLSGLGMKMGADSLVDFDISVANHGSHSLASLPDFPVFISYHWFLDKQLLIWDGLRNELFPPLNPERHAGWRSK